MGLYIYHIFKPRFCRVHMMFRNDGKNFHTFLIQSEVGYKFIPTGTNVIKGRKLRFVYNNPKTYLSQMMAILQKNKVHVVIASHYIPPDLISRLHHMKKRVYYINHGIWNKLAGKNFSKNTRSVDWTHFDGYFVTKNEKVYLNHIGIPDKKIHIINGSPQIDYLLSNSLSQKKRLFYRNISRKTGNIEPGTKYPLSLKKPCVLLVQNPDALNNLGRNKKDEPLVLDEYYKILKTLVKLSVTHNFHIITKFKKDTSTTVKRFKKALPLHKHKNVSVLYYSDQVLLYDLFFANVVIIEGFGTSFLESLMVNPKTVQCQILKHNDDLDIDRYDLLQADSQRDIISMIPPLIKNNSLITKQYMQSRKQYIEDQLGPLQRNISRFVTNTIRSEIVSK